MTKPTKTLDGLVEEFEHYYKNTFIINPPSILHEFRGLLMALIADRHRLLDEVERLEAKIEELKKSTSHHTAP